jgi:hypothetical protein
MTLSLAAILVGVALQQKAQQVKACHALRKLLQLLHGVIIDQRRVIAIEWEFVANLAAMFKPHLRPLLRHLPLAGQRQDADLLEAIPPDKYEFLVYRMLRNRLEAGDNLCQRLAALP